LGNICASRHMGSNTITTRARINVRLDHHSNRLYSSISSSRSGMSHVYEDTEGFTIQNGNQSTHVLRILQNLYGQKQAGRVWNHHIHQKLLELGWVQSIEDDCVYYKGNVIFVVYVDDGILLSPSPFTNVWNRCTNTSRSPKKGTCAIMLE
jgi:Reverse transcriptase (RNA-dependent DNA polymerase)